MATAKKLPSGNYRVRVYDKRIKSYKSFTADTKREAERMATEWLGKEIEDNSVLTVKQAAREYIDIKKKVLSPTTINGYEVILKNSFTGFLERDIHSLRPAEIQTWINELADTKTPKTVHNIFGFFTAIVNYHDVELKLSKITLPQKIKRFKKLPPAEVVLKLFKGTDIELPVLLACWCGLRMSEILGIRYCDIDSDGILTINQVMIIVNNKKIIKERAKNFHSNRQIALPKEIIKLLDEKHNGSSEPVVAYTRKQIYSRFKKEMTAADYDISFHDLRHVNASIMAALGIPDIYAMERGGWSNTTTLKSVYQQTFDSNRKAVDKVIDDFLSGIYSA